MRRHTEFLEAIVPGRQHKPEPARHPVAFSQTTESAAWGADEAVANGDRVLMAHRLGAAAARITRPLGEYRGVAIRIVPGLTEDEDRVAVVLSHNNPAYQVSLFEAEDDSDVIAEWRLWATTLGLPLLMESLDGHPIAAEHRLGEIEVDRPRPRRRHALLSGRRPRFLTRRRTGQLPLVPFVHRNEREIIAGE